MHMHGLSLPEFAFVTGVSAAFGITLWHLLIRRAGKGGCAERYLVKFALIGGLLLRVAIVLLMPPFQAPDERSHYNYIKYVAQTHSLPVQTSITGASTHDWENYQPPLYYILMAIVYRIAEHATSGDPDLLRVLRVGSIFLWLINLVIVCQFLKVLNLNDAGTKVSAIGLVAFLPTYTFSSAAVNNDNLLVPLASGVLCLGARKHRSVRADAAIGLLLGLAMLTKLTAVVCVAFLTAVYLYDAAMGRGWRLQVGRLALIVVIAGILYLPIAVRNERLYASLTGIEMANIRSQWPSGVAAIVSTLVYMQSTFWAVSGEANQVCASFPVGLVILLLSAIGIWRAVANRSSLLWRLGEEQGSALAGMVAGVLTNFVLVLRFGIMYGQGQGRFLFPMLGPIAVMVAIAIRSIWDQHPEKLSILSLVFASSYAVMFAAYSLTTFAHGTLVP